MTSTMAAEVQTYSISMQRPKLADRPPREIRYSISNVRQDDIDLRTIDANTERSGNNVFPFHRFQCVLPLVLESLRLRDSGSHIIVQGDVNGDGRSDFEILVRNVDTLSRNPLPVIGLRCGLIAKTKRLT